MNDYQFRLTHECPTCHRGKVMADGTAKIRISVHCPKCGHPFIVDLHTGRCEPSNNIRNRGRRK